MTCETCQRHLHPWDCQIVPVPAVALCVECAGLFDWKRPRFRLGPPRVYRVVHDAPQWPQPEPRFLRYERMA